MLDALPGIGQYIYCSSAGVYLKSDQMPHREEDAVDPKSRHKGKLDTEALLQASGVNYTSVRPVYIYGECQSVSMFARGCAWSHVHPLPLQAR